MQSIELIRENLGKSADLVLMRVEETKDFGLVFPTPEGGCHTLWVLGHLAYIEAQVIRTFMLGEANPLPDWEETFDGTDVSGDASRFSPFESASTPRRFDHLFGTRRQCLQYVADHWYVHRGQLADARRAAGLERMWV